MLMPTFPVPQGVTLGAVPYPGTSFNDVVTLDPVLQNSLRIGHPTYGASQPPGELECHGHTTEVSRRLGLRGRLSIHHQRMGLESHFVTTPWSLLAPRTLPMSPWVWAAWPLVDPAVRQHDGVRGMVVLGTLYDSCELSAFQGRMVNFSKRRKESQVMAAIQHLQPAAVLPWCTTGTRAWSGAVERLTDSERYGKPPPVSGAPASILVGWEEFPGLTPADVIKARMTRVSSTGGTSTGCLNLREASGLSWVLGIRQLCARIPPPLLTSPVIAVWVNLPIVTELVSVTSASRGTSSPSSSMKPGATLTTHTAHGSLPSSSQQVGDRCVSLDMVDGNMHKSILVNWAGAPLGKGHALRTGSFL
ncbi:uncharacterized protein LOC143673315 isoform X3 [Tamandua tetradactyla]|uniref:uncharacterized protein LOC143673315 isoform X3 n=1 Tax=Tamandua tetradactyla TaxID=48850 RepID=UPI004053ECAC